VEPAAGNPGQGHVDVGRQSAGGFLALRDFHDEQSGGDGMAAIVRPKLGFAPKEDAERVAEKLSTAGLEAARRRFTPEFLNRIDRIVTFQTLGSPELHKILDLELAAVRERLLHATGAGTLAFNVSKSAREFLLKEGTDTRYGARHLKRAVERGVVQPMSNLIASGQVEPGDRVFIECDPSRRKLVFLKDVREPVGQTTTGMTATAA